MPPKIIILLLACPILSMNLNLFPTDNPLLTPVTPVIQNSVRGLCVRPYEGHKKGCPNFNDPKHAHRCPPKAPFFAEHYDLGQPVFAVINEFDLGAHMKRMKERNPGWTDRQLRCVLYWQGTARKQLKAKIEAALATLPGYEATWCPEGMGVNVTLTLKEAGIDLEWPPNKIARQVAFLAKPKEK